MAKNKIEVGIEFKNAEGLEKKCARLGELFTEASQIFGTFNNIEKEPAPAMTNAGKAKGPKATDLKSFLEELLSSSGQNTPPNIFTMPKHGKISDPPSFEEFMEAQFAKDGIPNCNKCRHLAKASSQEPCRSCSKEAPNFEPMGEAVPDPNAKSAKPQTPDETDEECDCPICRATREDKPAAKTKALEPIYKSGEKVSVACYGNIYPTFDRFYKTNKTPECLPWIKNRTTEVKNGDKGTVMAYAEHPTENKMIYLVNLEDKQRCIIISEMGLEGISEPATEPDAAELNLPVPEPIPDTSETESEPTF